MFCEYGCGEEAIHQLKNGKWCCNKSWNTCLSNRKKNSQAGLLAQNRPEVRQRKSESVKKTFSTLESKLMRSEIVKRSWTRPETRERYCRGLNKPELKKLRREKLLNGQAVYMMQFIKNPSKPQVELFKMLQQLCPNPIMNYPIFYRKKWNYSIDIADPRLGLAFEYDEPYWHKHKGKDLRRQKRIEELGWKFLRYEKLPILERLKLDIIRVINLRS